MTSQIKKKRKNNLVIDGMKICNGCEFNKPASDFWGDRSHKHGLQSRCISCKTKWRIENREQCNSIIREWRKKNPGKMNAYASKWREKYPDRCKAAWSKWAKTHPDSACFKSAKRRAIAAKATPTWANRFFMQEAYDLARRRTKMLGERYVVDHIVPLQHDLVCGLHVESNMRVITDKQNASKCNYWWPDMP